MTNIIDYYMHIYVYVLPTAYLHVCSVPVDLLEGLSYSSEVVRPSTLDQKTIHLTQKL